MYIFYGVYCINLLFRYTLERTIRLLIQIDFDYGIQHRLPLEFWFLACGAGLAACVHRERHAVPVQQRRTAAAGSCADLKEHVAATFCIDFAVSDAKPAFWVLEHCEARFGGYRTHFQKYGAIRFELICQFYRNFDNCGIRICLSIYERMFDMLSIQLNAFHILDLFEFKHNT